MSGDPPNSFLPYYRTVNDELYAGRGKLTEELPGLQEGSVLNTAVEMLHSGAHTAFSALLSGYAFATNKRLDPYVEKLHWKVHTNVDRFEWINRLFVKGLTKDEVLEKYRNESNWRDELATLKG